jgi:hypothetical protein
VKRWRQALWAVRVTLAIAFALISVKLAVMAWAIPIEAGAILFTPILLMGALMSFWLALSCIFPSALRGGLGFWAGFGTFFSSW